MWKTVLAGTTALVIAGGSLAIAQSGGRTDGPRNQTTVEAINAKMDARVSRIKSRLRLTSEQEKNWPTVEAAIRDLAKDRATRMSERRAARDAAGMTQPNAIERMRRGADAMSARAASLKKFADVTEPFYNSLDDSQKQRFRGLLRVSGSAGMGRWDGRGPRFSEVRGGDHRGHHGHHGNRGFRDRDVR